jgi:hypothetical protein
MPTTAPMNGMKSGADAGTPWRRSSSTWPISCTKISSTRPRPNHQPPRSAYAPTETIIEPATVKIFSLKMTAPNLTMNATPAAIGPQIFRSVERSPDCGWIGS